MKRFAKWLGVALASLAMACRPFDEAKDENLCSDLDGAIDLNLNVMIDIQVTEPDLTPIEGVQVEFTSVKVPCGSNVAESMGTSRALSVSGVTNAEGEWVSPYPFNYNLRNSDDKVYLYAEVTAEWPTGPSSKQLAEDVVSYSRAQQAIGGTHRWSPGVVLLPPDY